MQAIRVCLHVLHNTGGLKDVPGMAFRYRCRSEPQMAVDVTLSMTSCCGLQGELRTSELSKRCHSEDVHCTHVICQQRQCVLIDLNGFLSLPFGGLMCLVVRMLGGCKAEKAVIRHDEKILCRYQDRSILQVGQQALQAFRGVCFVGAFMHAAYVRQARDVNARIQPRVKQYDS